MLDRKCNLNCIHCCVDKQFPEETLCAEDYFKIIDELSSWGIKQLSLGGGEPYCTPGLDKILEYASRKNMDIGFSTNGTLLTRANLRSIISSRVNRITISIDGRERIHDLIRGQGVFRKATSTIEKLILIKKRYGYPDVRINMVVLKQTVPEILHVYQLAKNYGIPLNLMVFIPGGAQKEGELSFTKEQLYDLYPSRDQTIALEKIINNLKILKRREGFIFNSDKFFDNMLDYYKNEEFKKTCFKFTCEIGVLSNGNITFCAQSDFLGNIRKTTLKKAWYSKNAVENRKRLEWCNDCFINCNYTPPLTDLLKDFLIYPVARKIRSIFKLN
ncbi:MAG TPA: radical SAM protein [Candidatus Lokiarchaeia archaeon]|nr:radical SAM protein [Candidatus Lokiarchaeia archaeon]